MRFWSCSNPECDYIESRLLFSNLHKLPVPFDEALTFLENERNEALKSIAIIGRGHIISTRWSKDNSTIVAMIRVESRPKYKGLQLRPYDAVYFGGTLGVVVEHSGNRLSLMFDASKNLPKEGQ
jgi:hypothetical protein